MMETQFQGLPLAWAPDYNSVSTMEHVLWCLYLKQGMRGRAGRESEHERVPHPF